jgi:hypothetical protein
MSEHYTCTCGAQTADTCILIATWKVNMLTAKQYILCIALGFFGRACAV